MTLQEILAFYKECLCGHTFVFELEEGHEVPMTFQESNLCHLLGIQHIVKGKRNASQYVGQSGYESIARGEVTFEILQKINPKGFKAVKKRMSYFPFVAQMLQTPHLIQFTTEGLPHTRMRFDLLLYHQTYEVYLHLGLQKGTRHPVYFPVSFFEDKTDRYVAGRKHFEVRRIRIVAGTSLSISSTS